MRLLLTILLLSLSMFATSQTRQKDTLRIAFLGDSFCAGGNASPFDSSWAGRMVTHYKTVYNKVIYYLLCTGGETTFKGKPFGSHYYHEPDYYFYSEPDSARNLEKSMRLLHPGDLCFIEYSGNDFAVTFYPCDTVMSNLHYYAHSLDSAGINFVMSGGSPRQNHDGTLLDPSYYTKSDTINTYVSTNYPANYGNIWTGLNRGDGRMIRSYLSFDSIHPNNTGHRYQYQGLINNEVSDKMYCNCKGYGFNFQMKKIGDSLSVSGTFLGYKMSISGSNDYSTFTPIVSYRSISGAVDKKIYGNDYIWYKMELFSNKIKKTITKRIN